MTCLVHNILSKNHEVNEELKFLGKSKKNIFFGGGGGGSGGRVDVNEELKFCDNSKKNGGGGRRVRWGGRVGGGSGWM